MYSKMHFNVDFNAPFIISSLSGSMAQKKGDFYMQHNRNGFGFWLYKLSEMQ